jgi:hypothetical protein
MAMRIYRENTITFFTFFYLRSISCIPLIAVLISFTNLKGYFGSEGFAKKSV